MVGFMLVVFLLILSHLTSLPISSAFIVRVTTNVTWSSFVGWCCGIRNFALVAVFSEPVMEQRNYDWLSLQYMAETIRNTTKKTVCTSYINFITEKSRTKYKWSNLSPSLGEEFFDDMTTKVENLRFATTLRDALHGMLIFLAEFHSFCSERLCLLTNFKAVSKVILELSV